ncbi:MAG TPA: tetratricopeptide repeat protein [Alphaproteobacteria bacterium]|nr:tetratricopeptide repeat protein [Alphaproteobacteria bacterium]
MTDAQLPAPFDAHAIGPAELPSKGRTFSHLSKRLATSSKAEAKSEAKNRKIIKLLRKALEEFRADNYPECCKLALQALDIDSEHPQANHVMAVGLERLGELSKSITFFERAMERDPNDNEIYFNLGLVAWRLQMMDAAERLFRIYIDKVPGSTEGYNNLAGVLRDRNQYEAAIEILRSALMRYPEDAQLWNSLGTVVLETGQMQEALTFFQEAAHLKPDFARAHHNIGYLYNHTGPYEHALQSYDQALSLPYAPEDRAETQHARALVLLQLGRVEEGFKQWAVRNDPRFRAAPIYGFNLPLWNDQPLEGKRVLLVAEQGLGDEIMYGNAIPDIIKEVGPAGKVCIACDQRLVPLFARSFPETIVGPHSGMNHNGKMMRGVVWLSKVSPIDYWAPFGTLLQYRRTRIEDFANKPPLLKADPERAQFWRSRLEALGPGPYVGISWKSLVMSGRRQKFYTPIKQWGPVLKVPGVKFVNLQYGNCASDIADAEQRFGVKVHNFEDLNLKDNLDDNAALCTALDLAISAPNAAAQIVGGVGTEIWYIAINNIWPQLGTDHVPWYPKTRIFEPKVYGDFDDGLAQAATALAEWCGQKRAAA